MRPLAPTDRAGPRILVIGAGVSGLTSALCLARRGFPVTLLADRFGSRVTSAVAGALWEWPPAVCGHQHDEAALARLKRWCATSYARFAELAADPATGVYLRRVTFYFREPISEDPLERAKVAEVARQVRGFRHDPALIGENGVNERLGYRDAYSYLAPMVDTDAYLPWLRERVQEAGCRIVERKLTVPLLECEAELRREYGVEAIVHCTGLGAGELGDPTVYPVRGALIRVRNDGRAMPVIEQAHCVSRSEGDELLGFLFILPRGRDRLVLGGFAEAHQWGLDIGADNHELIRTMHRRCVEFLPVLRKAEVDAAEPVRVGLRPFRRDGVRLEREAGRPVVHNYGHGGSGVTLSWGCAEEVAGLLA
jgi:D-amino-acid oxidase